MSLRFQIKETRDKEYAFNFLQDIEDLKHIKFIRGLHFKMIMKKPDVVENSVEYTLVKDRDNPKHKMIISVKKKRLTFEFQNNFFMYRVDVRFLRTLNNYFHKMKLKQEDKEEYVLDNFQLNSNELHESNVQNEDIQNLNDKIKRIDRLIEEIDTLKRQTFTRKKHPPRNFGTRKNNNDPTYVY